MEMISIDKELRENSYPGRGIIIGKSADGTKAATDGCDAHEGCFRNPPGTFFGFQLVRKHKQEGDGIN